MRPVDARDTCLFLHVVIITQIGTVMLALSLHILIVESVMAQRATV